MCFFFNLYFFSFTCSIFSCFHPSLPISVHIAHLNHVFLQGSLYRGQSRREKPRGRNQGLTQQKRQEIREAFELFDTDNSGNKINLKESILDAVFWWLNFFLTVNFCNLFRNHWCQRAQCCYEVCDTSLLFLVTSWISD